ncbi:DUF5714 domain-containing protein [Christensenellaceae bacterium OttesenSCG-928-K19]|nr:DUF5714 domain-containing protein [Christensenellaceae bacterium OttesenSCG-928-K19]
MEKHSTGCLVCGQPLHYFDPPRELACEFCGELFTSHAACNAGHYVCDACHAQQGFQSITEYALQTTSKNPAEIAISMMKLPYINMHGPEHHYLVPAALLTAYHNASGDIDLRRALSSALERAKNLPGGICGFWGGCGAGIGAGIFTSIVTSATPLAGREWQLSNLATSGALASIATHGGPRCCKRDALLSILYMVSFTKEHLNVQMECSRPVCIFSHKNNECKKELCLFHPKYHEEEIK